METTLEKPKHFAAIAREYGVNATEVSAIVIGAGVSVIEDLGFKFVAADDMHKIEPMLKRLGHHKRIRPKRSVRGATS